MVGVGAGLANAGLIPFVCGASPFLTGRALEQIKADVAYSRHHVVLCGMSPGMAYGELGPDPPLDRGPGLAARDRRPRRRRARRPGADRAARALGRRPRPAGATCGSPRQGAGGQRPSDAFLPGRRPAHRRRRRHPHRHRHHGRRRLAAADLAAKGSPRGCSTSRRQPARRRRHARRGRRDRAHRHRRGGHRRGGLGAAVAELVVQHRPCRCASSAIPGFAPTGSTEFLLDHFGLTADGIATAARELVR